MKTWRTWNDEHLSCGHGNSLKSSIFPGHHVSASSRPHHFMSILIVSFQQCFSLHLFSSNLHDFPIDQLSSLWHTCLNYSSFWYQPMIGQHFSLFPYVSCFLRLIPRHISASSFHFVIEMSCDGLVSSPWIGPVL